MGEIICVALCKYSGLTRCIGKGLVGRSTLLIYTVEGTTDSCRCALCVCVCVVLLIGLKELPWNEWLWGVYKNMRIGWLKRKHAPWLTIKFRLSDASISRMHVPCVSIPCSFRYSTVNSKA